MTCTACGEHPKENTAKGFPKAVVEINNPETLVLLRKVVIPASMGDETAFPPAIGKYFNVLLHYEASGSNYLYSSDGIPTEIGANIPQEVLDRIEALEDGYDDLAEDYEQLQSQVGDVSEALSAETSARELADGNLQTQIDAITASSDVKDIVGTKAELNNYDTSTLGNNDIIKVLQDESENNATTYYRWNATTQQFTLIGEEGPYYTKAATDTLLNAKQDVLTAGTGIDITNNVISATGGGGSSEVIKLSTDDYNWNHTTKTTTGTLDTVAVWLLQPGIYELSEDMYLSTNRDYYQSFSAKSMFIALPDAFAGPYTIRTVFVTDGTDIVKDTPTTRDGTTFIDSGPMLSETQMGRSKQLTSSLYNDWIDSSSTEYDCVDVSRLAPGVYYCSLSNVYIREYSQGPVVTGMDRVYIVSGNSGGGVNPKHILKMTPDGISYISLTGGGTFVSETPVLLSSSIVQTTGTSTSTVMSQNAVTDAINNAGFVSNTDYASSTTAGVLKVSNGVIVGNTGDVSCSPRTYADYATLGNSYFISKGTLENVIAGKELVTNQDISGKANKISVVQTSASTIEINPNTFYKFGEVASLNITLASITDNTIYNEYMFEFVSGSTATTLTLPSSIKWLETPTIDANKIYQCSIVDNIGILVGVTNV